MALPGEIGHSFATCSDCAQVLTPQVLRSGAGFYIGTFCHCGPYSRESGYYPSREAAQADLDALRITRPRV
jgi:hypothetical protein